MWRPLSIGRQESSEPRLGLGQKQRQGHESACSGVGVHLVLGRDPGVLWGVLGVVLWGVLGVCWGVSNRPHPRSWDLGT